MRDKLLVLKLDKFNEVKNRRFSKKTTYIL